MSKPSRRRRRGRTVNVAVQRDLIGHGDRERGCQTGVAFFAFDALRPLWTRLLSFPAGQAAASLCGVSLDTTLGLIIYRPLHIRTRASEHGHLHVSERCHIAFRSVVWSEVPRFLYDATR